jgi:hypothetical protein
MALASLAHLCSAVNRPLQRGPHPAARPARSNDSTGAAGRGLRSAAQLPQAPVLEGPVETWPPGLTTIFPYNYYEWCDADAACQETGPVESATSYHADPAPFIAHTSNWPFTFADQEPGSQVQVLSGVVEYQQSTSADGFICNSTIMCTMTFTLPIDPAVYTKSNTTAHRCLVLEEAADGSLTASDDIALVATDVVVRDRLLCYGNLNARYMAVQYTRTAAAASAAAAPTMHVAATSKANATASHAHGGELPACPRGADHNPSFVDGRLRLTGAKIMFFTFEFDVGYYKMFYPKGLGTYTAEFPRFVEFGTLARQSLIWNIAARTDIRVETADCELEVGRIKVMSTSGTDDKTEVKYSFLVPSSASKEQLKRLSAMVAADPGAFFKGPFYDKYHAHVHLGGHSAALLNEDQITLVAGMGVLAVTILVMVLQVLLRKHARKMLVAEKTVAQRSQRG